MGDCSHQGERVQTGKVNTVRQRDAVVVCLVCEPEGGLGEEEEMGEFEQPDRL